MRLLVMPTETIHILYLSLSHYKTSQVISVLILAVSESAQQLLRPPLAHRPRSTRSPRAA